MTAFSWAAVLCWLRNDFLEGLGFLLDGLEERLSSIPTIPHGIQYPCRISIPPIIFGLGAGVRGRG